MLHAQKKERYINSHNGRMVGETDGISGRSKLTTLIKEKNMLNIVFICKLDFVPEIGKNESLTLIY